ncbi:hypothetical protein [Okeania sp.]|uniref:hypothetical protein n=1 Tax=Okeania sp. TaxID=3100323 RepID=UPI002B4B936A|nr:hypothetical protein [Okeania sp.]MEB3341208.1 hypothetical protein [Okeania sp.]
MNKKNLALALFTVVFLAACDVGNNSHIKLKDYNYPSQVNPKKVRTKNDVQSNINTNYVVNSCQEFMEDEMGFPRNGRWSSESDITKTELGWKWGGWVEFDGEKSNFVCNIDNNKVTAYTFDTEPYSYHFPDDSSQYEPDIIPDNSYQYKNPTNTSSVVSSCQEFMEYEMGFPRNGKWSSQKDVRKTIEGWEWRGWVDVYGERNKFVCTVDNNGVRVSTNFEDSYNYEYEYTY